jgi:hypothetical protein
MRILIIIALLGVIYIQHEENSPEVHEPYNLYTAKVLPTPNQEEPNP